jgi:hypothetical protein
MQATTIAGLTDKNGEKETIEQEFTNLLIGRVGSISCAMLS